ncbi:MAG: phasin family protein [Rhodocyclaceae bacterium]|nr:phasin family protein [Rhodocyclaceae bacterium]
MVTKTIKNLPGVSFANAVQESYQRIWLAGLGAFFKARDEGVKVFESLVKEGEAAQAKTTERAGKIIAAASRRRRAEQDRFEEAFQNRIALSISRLGVASKLEYDAVSRNVNDLAAALKRLAAERPGGTPATE